MGVIMFSQNETRLIVFICFVVILACQILTNRFEGFNAIFNIVLSLAAGIALPTGETVEKIKEVL